MSMLLRRIRESKVIYDEWTAGAKLADLAPKYGYRGPSGVYTRILDYEDILRIVGAIVPKRDSKFNTKRKKTDLHF